MRSVSLASANLRRLRQLNIALAAGAALLCCSGLRAEDAPAAPGQTTPAQTTPAQTSPAPAAPAPAVAAAPEASSPTQELLFDKPYMSSVQAPSKMVYSFKSATADDSRYGRSFDDQASMTVEANKDDATRRDVSIRLFSGDRERELPGITGVSGNPILMVFLERDMSRMKMHVGGQPVYYRNRIRAALRENAKVEPAAITYGGKTVNGSRISIRPFLEGPLSDQLQLFKNKIYEFTVSEAVPGGIYQIRSIIPPVVGAGPGSENAKPLIEESLTFARLEAGGESSKSQ